ncbi:dTMP kinase [Sphingorhabdus lutea]|uniref:Thymidylate kinase n=1 Tax=Sphingorhabdus lutea TaxID=1913578 RepID=A0A1L3JC47_9SPHN|nr:dTMP kinase [Sphingorhabdus lutea]APG62700.1 dTMP kinase [Sphingorhabdus lutea]
MANGRGKFISIEGGEGVGKSTQIALLCDALNRQSVETIISREPGGTDAAEEIRQILLSGNDNKFFPRAEALLFAAARSEHVERLIEPALQNGKWVICDRFIDSSRAYQSGGSGLKDEEIMTLHQIGSGGLLPDATILLDMDLSQASHRVQKRQKLLGDDDRIGSREAQFHENVRAAFLSYTKAEPTRFHVIKANQDIDIVAKEIFDIVSKLMS